MRKIPNKNIKKKEVGARPRCTLGACRMISWEGVFVLGLCPCWSIAHSLSVSVLYSFWNVLIGIHSSGEIRYGNRSISIENTGKSKTGRWEFLLPLSCSCLVDQKKKPLWKWLLLVSGNKKGNPVGNLCASTQQGRCGLLTISIPETTAFSSHPPIRTGNLQNQKMVALTVNSVTWCCYASEVRGLDLKLLP